MNTIQIMVLGNNEMEITPIIQAFESTNEWQVNSFTDKEKAINHFHNITQDVVIFGKEVDASIRNGLEKIFRFQNEDVIVLFDVDEKSIWDDVNNALHQLADSKKASYTFVDDALKNARFNISMS